MKTDISIILNCYNLEKYIGEAVSSLLNQDYSGGYEILVINDASTDNSLKILQSFSDHRLQILNLTENRGARYGVELAYERSVGKYICRFDGDDIWKPKFLRVASRVLDQMPGISMVYSDVSMINENGMIESEKDNINRKLKEIPVLENEFVEILQDYYINAPTIMFRREAFARALPMPAFFKNFIDYYISLKVLASGKAYYIDTPLAYYRIHPGNGHKKVIKNRTNEEVTVFILNEVVLNNASLTKKMKKEVAARNYLRLADDYFGVKMFKLARNNYYKSFINNRRYVFKMHILKHFVGTIIGISMYNRIGSFFRKS